MVRLTPPMSSDVKIPEWAMEAAGKIADVWQHPMHHDHQILSQDIAIALLAAEQRGMEKAAEVAEGLHLQETENHGDLYDGDVATAIRQLGETT